LLWIGVVVVALMCCGMVTSLSTLKGSNAEREAIVNAVNSDPHSTWRAKLNDGPMPVMRSLPLDLQRRVNQAQEAGLRRVESATASEATEAYDGSLPINFDARVQWPNCIHGVLNQGDCGSCWAFASTEVLSDRYCIYSNESINIVLSPQNLLSCEKMNLKCTMGSLPEWAWSFLEHTGVATMDCDPYVSGNGTVPKCEDREQTCANDTAPFELYTAESYGQVGDFLFPSHHIEAIMAALTQGPVDATFSVYADFMTYESGVYKHTYGGFEGLHSVKVIGYGVENGTDYWLVQNSWGESWGELGGFFNIIRGIDDCGFESLMFTGLPNLDV